MQHLLSYSLTLCPGSCVVERLFSKLNIPSKRNRCDLSTLEMQLLVNELTPKLSKEERDGMIAQVMVTWMSGKHRRSTGFINGGRKLKPKQDPFVSKDRKMVENAQRTGGCVEQ